MKTEEQEKAQLRLRITKITKRAPRESASLSYLRARLAMLEQKLEDGEDVRSSLATNERTRPHSVSLTDAQGEALAKLCDRTRKGASALVRAALAHYALTHGHASIARTFDPDINTDKE